MRMRRHYRLHIGFEDSPKYEGREDDVLSEFRRVRDEIKETFCNLYNKEMKGNVK